MSANKKHLVRRYRATCGEQYCRLDFRFHEKGLLLPDAKSLAEAAVFNHLAGVRAAIKRTINVQADVRSSYLGDLPTFAPLSFQGSIEDEPFEQWEELS